MATDAGRSTGEGPWREVWRASWTWPLYHLLSAVVMLPFGLFLSAGLVAGVLTVPALVSDLVGLGIRGVGAAALALGAALFGVFLAYALLRHGGACVLDVLGARRTVEGPVEKCGVYRGSKGSQSYWIELRGLRINVPAVAHAKVRVGTVVRARCGRFERELTALWVPG